jgi:predicted Fe-Mo cluster-binding NifX family protein/NifU-like protein involved in Fe-S cluster formation
MRHDPVKETKLLPANSGPLRDAGGNARIAGPRGDTKEFRVRPEGDRVARVSFTTDGCGHSMRSGSAAAALAEGKTIGDALRIGQEEVLEATGGLPEESRHCALLAADTLRAALLDCRSAETGQGESGMGTGECGSCGTGPCEARPAQPGERPEERRALRLPVLGIVENMSGFACPPGGRRTEVFGAGGGERMAEEMGVPFLGRVPLDPLLGEACEGGKPYIRHFPGTPTSRAFETIREPILKRTSPAAGSPAGGAAELQRKEDTVRIAIPLAEGLLAMHFGHCAQFALIDVDPKARKVLKREDIEAPPHQPGLLPSWLAERGVQVVIAGGMGQRALGLFAERGIKVVVGAPAEKPEKLAADFMADTLRAGENVCDH